MPVTGVINNSRDNFLFEQGNYTLASRLAYEANYFKLTYILGFRGNLYDLFATT